MERKPSARIYFSTIRYVIDPRCIYKIADVVQSASREKEIHFQKASVIDNVIFVLGMGANEQLVAYQPVSVVT